MNNYEKPNERKHNFANKTKNTLFEIIRYLQLLHVAYNPDGTQPV